jgi:hypothetical protein
MPNGGSDCCGTCWFNSVNEGEPGYERMREQRGAEVRCVIRDLVIEEPFWTYCANHPHHNPTRIEIPIGPVYDDKGGYPYERSLWKESPDTEEIRENLLALLKAIPDTPHDAHLPLEYMESQVMRQLALFKEKRAVESLIRIANFDPLKAPTATPLLEIDRAECVCCAIEALAIILGDEALPQIERGLKCHFKKGLKLWSQREEHKSKRASMVRYCSVRALRHCSTEESLKCLNKALHDTNSEVVELAREILKEKQTEK